jgi:hypothetical protein
MKVDVSTELACSAAKAWNEVQKSSLLLRVIWPLARIEPLGGGALPERWSEGPAIECKLFVFGIIPIGMHTLHFEKIDHEAREIRTHEHDRLVARWDHVVSVRPLGENRSIYRDLIDIDAGSLTVLVWAWASWFYRHRQRRWRALAKTL